MDVRIAMVLSLCAACGASPDDPAASAGGSGEDSSSSSSSEDGEQLTHGTVRFEFRRAEDQATNPSVGTASVSITMTYRDCLSTFYEENPSMRQTGPDGEAVFGSSDLGGEGWTDRLCDPADEAALVMCSVESITQTLDIVEQLTVRYAIAGELENRVLRFGPLPTSETAGCSDPIVRASPGGIKGYGQDGTAIWEASSVTPLDALTNQGGGLSVGMELIAD